MTRTRMVGNTLYVREAGRWRPAKPSEETAYDTGPGQAFGLGVAAAPFRWAGDAMDVARTFASAAAPVSASQYGVAPRQLTGPEQAANAVSQFSPFAVGAGDLAANLAPIAPSLAATGWQAAGSIASRVKAALSAAGQKAGGNLERTLGEKTGIGAVQSLEAAVGSQGGFAGLARRRTQVLGRAAVKAIGEEGDKLSTEVMGRAASRIGAGMDEVLAGDFTLSPTTREALAAVPSPGAKLGALIKRVEATDGPLPGDLIKNLRRQISDRMAAARGSDDLLWQDLATASEGLVDDLSGQMGKDTLDRWRTLRIQYKNLMTLERVPEVRHSGTLTARQAGNALNSSYGHSYLYGKGVGDPATDELMNVTRQLAELKPIPDSGTATRLGPLIGAAAGAATGNDPAQSVENAAVGAGAGYLVPAALGRALLAAGRLAP